MKKNLLLLLMPFVLFSCKPNKGALLSKTWRATSLESKENDEMDSSLNQWQKAIDTAGQNTDSASNLALYGTTNIDSIKHVLQVKLDGARTLKAESVTSTIFQFRKDSVAVITLSGQTDSMRWQIDADTITLSALNGIGSLEEIRMEIISIADTTLRLKFRKDGANCIVSFHPEM